LRAAIAHLRAAIAHLRAEIAHLWAEIAHLWHCLFKQDPDLNPDPLLEVMDSDPDPKQEMHLIKNHLNIIYLGSDPQLFYYSKRIQNSDENGIWIRIRKK
jgi:hypothetical protein